MLRAGALAVGVLLAACQPAPASKPAEEQAVTDPAAINPVVHFEIPVTDMDRAIRFYEAVFAVKLDRRETDGYHMAFFPRADGRPGASGALAKGDVYKPTRDGAILYFGVPDIDAVIARAEAAGGSVLYPKKGIGEAGFVAEIGDTEGNRIALSQAAE